MNNAVPTFITESEKTGQGKQTTTQAYAHTYSRTKKGELLVVDLQGFSNFGLTHLLKPNVQEGFPEFIALRMSCQFNNCMHLEEPICAIRQAVESGKIASSRYQTYCQVLEEIDSIREY